MMSYPARRTPYDAYIIPHLGLGSSRTIGYVDMEPASVELPALRQGSGPVYPTDPVSTVTNNSNLFVFVPDSHLGGEKAQRGWSSYVYAYYLFVYLVVCVG
jgi:hypothetical protein